MTSVLIVDDSATARMMLRHWIQHIKADFKIVEADSGEAALECLRKLPPGRNLAIVDYNMPGMTGLELVDQLLQHIPPGHIALCTANLQDAIRNRALGKGIHYVAKPINLAKLSKLFGEMKLS